jgi:hypothetical protein
MLPTQVRGAARNKAPAQWFSDKVKEVQTGWLYYKSTNTFLKKIKELFLSTRAVVQATR